MPCFRCEVIRGSCGASVLDPRATYIQEAPSITNMPHFTPPCATITTQWASLGSFFLKLAKQPADSPGSKVGSVNFSSAKGGPYTPKIALFPVAFTLKPTILSPNRPTVGESGDSEEGTKKPSPCGEGSQAGPATSPAELSARSAYGTYPPCGPPNRHPPAGQLRQRKSDETSRSSLEPGNRRYSARSFRHPA